MIHSEISVAGWSSSLPEIVRDGWRGDPSRDDAAAAPRFALLSQQARLYGFGHAAALPPGPVTTLADRTSRFFDAASDDALLMGAIPFDRQADDCLNQPERLVRERGDLVVADIAAQRWTVRHELDAADYAACVRQVTAVMGRERDLKDGLRKIVLSRALFAQAEAAIDVPGLLTRLALDPAVTTFLMPLPPGYGSSRQLVGATPELLVAKQGRWVRSFPLAGSAPRSTDLAKAASSARGLLASAKDRREHAMVVDYILDTLAPFCRRLRRPEDTALTSTASMWHLGTRIEGELKDPSIPVAALVAALHPTPAVCGLPRDRAASLIEAIEPHDRGFYAGAVGWCDSFGDGAWHVAIRCAEILENAARLYAGAGIIQASDPDWEVAETGAKYRAMMRALGIEGQGDRA